MNAYNKLEISCFELSDNKELNEMYKSLLLLSLVGVVCAQQNLDFDCLINELFSVPPKATEAPSITVAKYDTIIQPDPQPQGKEPEDQPCTTSDVKDGQCVRYYLCDTNNTIIQDGLGIMDIRSNVRRLHRTARDLPPSEERPSSFQAFPCPSYLDMCCNVPDALKKAKSDKQIRKPNIGCGWRNPYGVDLKTTAGKVGESLFGEFPWMVAILRIENLNDAPSSQKINFFVGGGSLIHPAVVLTTAHHVDTINTLRVRAGEWNTQSSNEIYPHQDRDVDSVIVHEEYNTERNNLFYDIALLFLSSPMDTSIPNVGLACLPPPNQRTHGGESCVASGWGKDKFGTGGRYQFIMKKVIVPVVERQQCQTQLRKTHLGRFFELHSSFMCAGGEAGIDTCNEDGGSPLMCRIENESNRFMQIGMVAWGVGCGNEGVPGVYVDVSNLRDWIDDQTTNKGFDPKVYTF